MQRETAVSLIRTEVLPRLTAVERATAEVKGILITAGLDNGNGEGAATLKEIVQAGIETSHRKAATDLFMRAWFGWLTVTPKRLMAVVGAISTIGWAALAVVNIWDRIPK